MSSNPLPDISAADQEFARHWAESAAHVLGELRGAAFTATPLSPGEPEDTAFEIVWARFRASGRLAGEFAFQIAQPDAVMLTQLLKSETLDGATPFDERRADALSEILRQFAGNTASKCKTAYGGEVQFSLESNAKPEWKPAGRAVWVFASANIDTMKLTMTLSAELHAVLSAPTPTPPPEAPVVEQPEPRGFDGLQEAAAAAAQTAEPGLPSNLDLLLDVQLEASLRFGQREMLLRDILELHPGSVIELDRRVQEPAELIVSGRVIAHGEVVIVDGNYGLRITNITQPSQRLESVET
jgi:flagellar motor switch protein FliN/FliY